MSTKERLADVCTSSLDGVSAPTAVTVVKTEGSGSVTETNKLTFKNLILGQSVTVDGLTLTALDSIDAADVAAGFASLAPGAPNGNPVEGGKWSGAMTDAWFSEEANGAVVYVTSTTEKENVTDLVVSSKGTTQIDPDVIVDALIESLDNELITRLTHAGTRVYPADFNIEHCYNTLVEAVEELQNV